MLPIEHPALARLLAYMLSDDGKWPLQSEVPILRELNTWVAFREHDKKKLIEAADWPQERAKSYRIDPLAERISDAWASFIFGDEPRVVPGGIVAEGQQTNPDQQLLDMLLDLEDGEASALASDLERAAGLCSSEGEIWARCFVDKQLADRPLLEWHSRLAITPLWVGTTLAAAALCTELPDPEKGGKRVFRHFELHAPGVVANVLFEGKANSLGKRVDLDQHPTTAPLDLEVWEHGLPGMLLARIPNRVRGNPRLGVSDYKGIKDYLLDLNDAAATGASNARLAARKRVVISSSVAQSAGTADGNAPTPENPGSTSTRTRVKWDPEEDVFVEDPLDIELGKASSDPYRVLEYSFDAAALIAWKEDLVVSAIARAGLVAQYVGVNDQTGYAISGTAYRLRLIPTDKTGRAKGRYWDDGLPVIIGNLIRLDAMPVENGGFGRPWQKPDARPTIDRRPGIPVDELEDAQRHSVLMAAGAESTRTAVASLHPEWLPDRVDEEVALILEERAKSTPGGTGSLFGV